MYKILSLFAIPIIIFASFYHFIPTQRDLILITLLISTIICWATSIIPNYQTSLIFLFTALLFSLSTKEIIFSGFASGAFWLVFAGMLIATAIKNVKLSDRFSDLFMKLKTPNYLKILIAVNIFSVLFSFVMPSSVGRVVLLVPIADMVAKNFGFKKEDKGYIGIVLTFILSTAIPAFAILPANVPNMILAGLTNSIYHHELLYSHYFLINFLVFGFIKDIVIVALLYLLYKDTPTHLKQKPLKIPLSKDEKVVILATLVMLAFWMSDFIHHIPASIIAIVGVLFLASPAINVIKIKDIKQVNFASLLFVAAIIGLGNIVAHDHFIKNILTQTIDLYVPTNYPLINKMIITSFMSFSGVFITQPALPAIFTPMAAQLSQVTHFSLNQIFMMEVAAFSTVFVPFQTAPLLIGLALSNIKQIKIIKPLLLLAVITVLFLYPLQYYWMQFVETFIESSLF
jgi:di/tricarboxylate transporter